MVGVSLGGVGVVAGSDGPTKNTDTATGTTGVASTLDLGPGTTTTTTLTLAAGFVPGTHTLAIETPAGTATTTVAVRTSR